MTSLHRFFIYASWLLVMVVGVRAQTETVEIGSIIESSLSSGETHNYALTVLETSIVSLYVESLDTTLDPILRLLDSSGNLIVSNDDYNYPDTHDALIQAFIIPRTDTYTLEVSTFGDTSGNYRLSILPGYDQLSLADTTIAGANWQPADNNVTITSDDNDQLQAGIEGIAQTGTLIATHFPPKSDFYFEVQFSDIMASTGWQIGIVFRYIDLDQLYQLVLNDQGFWQLEHVNDEETNVVESWRTHPAIVPGVNEFRLGILTSSDSFDIVFDGQVIGTVYDDSLMQPGSVGITAITPNALGSQLSFVLEEAIMTTPTRIDDRFIFPEVLIANNVTSLAHTLERQQVIPVGGEIKFTVPQSTIRYIEPGISRFPVASGVEFSEFVMGGTLSWEIISEGTGGCGITFNDRADDNYALAYINALGEYGVSYRQGDSFAEGIFGDGLAPDDTSHTFILIVHDDMLHYYIDNQHVGTMAYTPVTGEISTAVVNFDGVDTTCIFDNLWLWSLDSS